MSVLYIEFVSYIWYRRQRLLLVLIMHFKCMKRSDTSWRNQKNWQWPVTVSFTRQRQDIKKNIDKIQLSWHDKKFTQSSRREETTQTQLKQKVWPRCTGRATVLCWVHPSISVKSQICRRTILVPYILKHRTFS